MKIHNLSLVFIAANAFQLESAHAENIASFQSSVEMLGSTNLHYDPIFLDQVAPLLSEQQQIDSLAPQNRVRHTEESSCSPGDIDLTEFKQWQQEKGYWIGTYTFLGQDGNAFRTSSWNYPYGNYKGFITGEVFENAYRQRNVFLYPPQDTDICNTISNTTIGEGVCGLNGNTKIFGADQQVTICNEESDQGTIEGLYLGMLPTKTTLVGNENALLYQVYLPDGSLLQSQLTTLTENAETQQLYRTRSAQGFAGASGLSNYLSYYRETKVTEEEFFNELASAIDEYKVSTDDLCKYDNNGKKVIESGSFEACVDHLNQSFKLEADMNAQKSEQPTAQPSEQPTSLPTALPTAQPTSLPTAQPSGQPSAPSKSSKKGKKSFGSKSSKKKGKKA